MRDDEFVKSRLCWIFGRRGASGRYTRLFDELGQKEKDFLATAARLSHEELPVLGGVEGNGGWFILTTQRVVWSLCGERHEVRVSEVTDAFVDFRAMVREGVDKSAIREICIETAGGKRHTLAVEAGASLTGVWSVLKNLGKRSRKDQS